MIPGQAVSAVTWVITYFSRSRRGRPAESRCIMPRKRHVSKSSPQQLGDDLFCLAEASLGVKLTQEERKEVLEQLIKSQIEKEIKAFVAENGLLEDKVDFAVILKLAEQLLVEASRLTEWACNGPLDETGAEMLLRIGEQWLALESILITHRIAGKE